MKDFQESHDETSRVFNISPDGVSLPGPDQLDSSQPSVGRVRRIAEAAILFAEITPVNETLRVAAGAGAIAAGADPLLAAGAFAGANLVIEGGAAVAAASWLTTERSRKTVDWFNEKMEKRGIPTEAKFDPLTKGAIAYLGGSAIVSAVKFREEPGMSEKEIRNYGLRSAVILSGVVGVQGYFVAQGVETPQPLTVAGALVAVGSIPAIYKFAKNKLSKKNTSDVDKEQNG